MVEETRDCARCGDPKTEDEFYTRKDRGRFGQCKKCVLEARKGICTCETKPCIQCGDTKPIGDFYRVKKGEAKRQSRCKVCDNGVRKPVAQVHRVSDSATTEPARARISRKPCAQCQDVPTRRPETGLCVCKRPYYDDSMTVSQALQQQGDSLWSYM